MASMMNEIEDFINGAVVTWMESCLPRPELMAGYSSLLDGSIIHSVWLQIDPEPQHHLVPLTGFEGPALCNARSKNFDAIIRNIRSLYEEELGQTILTLPDCSVIGYTPETRAGLEQMKILLTLLLGAAVQCPNKEIFIGRIKQLDVDTQHGIVDLIKLVTDTHSLVLTQEAVELLTPSIMYNHVLRITKERDAYHSKWISSITQDHDNQAGAAEGTQSIASSTTSGTNSAASSESNHQAVELADLKSKLRKIRQELEEKSESYMEVKEELDHKNNQYEKLRTESHEWYTEAKRAAAYRDEVDVLRERAERADRLEIEVQKLREKLTDAEFYKTRVEELREDNRMLLETKEMLEDQLQRSRKRSEHVMSLETEIIKYKQKLNDMSLERDVDKSKLQELVDENTQLQLATKCLNNTADLEKSMSETEDDCNSGDNSLSEQLTNNAQTRVLKLELENRRLVAALDQIKEATFHETTNKLLDLEKDKKKLSLKLEQGQENYQRLNQQNKELEDVFQNALEENKKLQDAIDLRQKAHERQSQEREIDRTKLADFEKHVESLNKDKQRLQTLNDSIQRRADDTERLLESKSKEIDNLKVKSVELDAAKKNIYEIESKINTLERENGSLTKEVVKLKENLETKSVQLDQNLLVIENQTKEINKLTKDLEATAVSVKHLQDLEKQNQDLVSQHDIDTETIATLQKDLINGTLATKKVKTNLEKLGLDNSEFENTELIVEHVVEKLVKNPETFKTVCEIMLNTTKQNNKSDMCVLCHRKEIFTVEKQIDITGENESDLLNETEVVVSSVSAKWKEQCDQLCASNLALQNANESLQAENARQKVDVSTLGSQVTSLNTQHVALQLANSQLAAEKDVLLKKVEHVRQEHKNLLHDQVTLQCLHEQLGSEYESLSKDKENLKIILRDIRNENRDLKEKNSSLDKKIEDVQLEMSNMKSSGEDLIILRAEHSKLTDDFRNLFSTNERYKNEYKNIQEQYKIIRSENGRLKLTNTDLTGELNSRVDLVKSLELEYTKMTQKCEMLLQMNANLDTDRRTLMDHVSQLLSQYHELLAHSLEDKQHYHDEEKNYTDKVNSLNRQKEKLEEKIMEHYRKLDSCTTKKKAFGSSFVKRVKKASSDLMNKVPSRNRRSWIEDSRLTQSQFTLGSESGGNESDNSTEEPISVASDSNIIQRNALVRQSLQRKPTEKVENSFVRGGVRGSLQTLKRDEINNSRRNSVHGLEAPDVTGSSLTLGTAGSRRTVYLIDDNQKLPESQSPNPSEAPTPTNNTSASENNATYLMYNRINTIIGGNIPSASENRGSTSEINNIPASGQSANSEKSTSATGTPKKRPDDKSNSIWYEYGCV